MLSRRENLLVAPWQKRRFMDHRRKVEAALPAVDVKCPLSRDHVTLKQKKVQREYERCKKIEYDNFILMKHLNNIMSTKRVDNSWDTPLPDFLHRIAMFPIRRKESPVRPQVPPESPKTRRERCIGCTPKYFETELLVPEARVPYNPPKPRLSRRRSSVLAQEQMNKEIDRLHNLDLYRKKQNAQHHFRSQRSLSSSLSQRTNSYETSSHSPRYPDKSTSTNQKSRIKLPPTRVKHESANRKKMPSSHAKTKLPSTNQKQQVTDLTLSTVHTYSAGERKDEKKSKKKCVRSKMKQIELKQDALELVLIFPAQSKVTKSKI